MSWGLEGPRSVDSPRFLFRLSFISVYLHSRTVLNRTMAVLQEQPADQGALAGPSIHLESLETSSGRDRRSSDVPPEGAQTFIPPNASAVKTKLIASTFVMFLAGMNGSSPKRAPQLFQPYASVDY